MKKIHAKSDAQSWKLKKLKKDGREKATLSSRTPSHTRATHKEIGLINYCASIDGIKPGSTRQIHQISIARKLWVASDSYQDVQPIKI